MTLMDTVGAQQIIITDELEDDEDGIAAWAALVIQFEYNTEDVRIQAATVIIWVRMKYSYINRGVHTVRARVTTS